MKNKGRHKIIEPAGWREAAAREAISDKCYLKK